MKGDTMRNTQFATGDDDMAQPFFTQCRVPVSPNRAHATFRPNIALNAFVLYPNHNKGLGHGPSITLPVSHATDICLIRLDQTGQNIPARQHHGHTPSMQPSSTYAVTNQPRCTLVGCRSQGMDLSNKRHKNFYFSTVFTYFAVKYTKKAMQT